ncbi:MAG: hypothetical protein KatS3mg110_1725 [Pirellulaceae bacterium]|nr:MAG: hypothetical protein KatS3mg110_1725 [Pirellulaceae bacterium]
MTVRKLAWTAVWLAGWSLVVPGHLCGTVWAEEARAVDIHLGPQGELRGVYVDETGRGQAGVPIEIRHQLRPVARCVTGVDGEFCVTGLRGGLYQVVGPNAATAARLWAAGTAPPQAAERLTVAAQTDLVRGQRPFAEIITNPLVIGAVIAAAIAIPIAVHNSGKDRTGS